MNFGEVGINFRSQGDGRFGVRVEGSQRETQKFHPIKFVLVFFFLYSQKARKTQSATTPARSMGAKGGDSGMTILKGSIEVVDPWAIQDLSA